MTNIAVEITARCENCNEIIAVNAAVNKIWCSKCKGATLFPDELWGMILTDIIAEADEMHLGEARKTSIENPKAGVERVSFKKINLFCSHCHKVLPANIENEQTIVCSHCSATIIKRPVSPKFKNTNLHFF